jgi:hypothetical protein
VSRWWFGGRELCKCVITLKMAKCGHNMLVTTICFMYLINSQNIEHMKLKLNNLLSILSTWNPVNHTDKLEETKIHKNVITGSLSKTVYKSSCLIYAPTQEPKAIATLGSRYI